MDMRNIMIVGVGGQGTLLASKLLGQLLLGQGLDVKVSEVHGMSQRGGSVVTYVRCGQRVCSPIITQGEADCIVSFEQLEAARWLPWLRKGGLMITNTQRMDPMPVINGAAVYPEGIIDKLRAMDVEVDALDCLTLAEQAGSPRAVNIVLMGRLSRRMPYPESAWEEALAASVPPKFLEINRRAFALGRGAD